MGSPVIDAHGPGRIIEATIRDQVQRLTEENDHTANAILMPHLALMFGALQSALEITNLHPGPWPPLQPVAPSSEAWGASLSFLGLADLPFPSP